MARSWISAKHDVHQICMVGENKLLVKWAGDVHRWAVVESVPCATWDEHIDPVEIIRRLDDWTVYMGCTFLLLCCYNIDYSLKSTIFVMK